MASEWDVIGEKPRSWEFTVAETLHTTRGKNAYLYVLEMMAVQQPDKAMGSPTDWRLVLGHLDFFERKDDESI